MRMRSLFQTLIPLLLAAGLSAGCAPRASYIDLYGEPASSSEAERTIVIHPNTKYVNVEGGEVIRFVVGDKEFGWNFFVARGVDSFNLNDVAPPGMLDHVVTAYVSPDPRYIGGDGGDVAR